MSNLGFCCGHIRSGNHSLRLAYPHHTLPLQKASGETSDTQQIQPVGNNVVTERLGI